MNLTITPGETGDWLVEVQTAAGAAQPLTALTNAWFTVKSQADGNDPGLAQATIGSGITVLDAAGGLLQVVLTSAQTSVLADGTDYRWDMRLKFADADSTVSNPKNLSGILSTNRRVTYSL